MKIEASKYAVAVLLMINAVQSGVVPQDSSDVSITIYNNNRAFVYEKRETNVTAGKQQLIYEGVAGSMITSSVIPRFEGIETRLYSQNYIYDLITLDSMLKNSVDKDVEFYTNGKNPTLSSGTLLSVSPTVLIKQSGTDKIMSLDSPTQVVFPKVPENMITKPSLVWNIETAKEGKLDIDLAYLTNGVSWKSDYVMNMDKGSFDLVGWITVNNNSGVSYKNAKIACIAGDVGEVDHPVTLRKNIRMMEDKHAPQVSQEAFAGYHLYKIPFRETIADKQQKQIKFIDISNAKYKHYGRLTNNYFENYGTQKLHFANIIEFENTKANQMGMPLPGGIVRMYQKDSNGESRFMGEGRIFNTPADERIKLKSGMLFDVTGEKKITKFVARKGYRNVETTYIVHNRGDEPITLKIDENIPVYGNSIKTKTSCKGVCSFKKENAFVRTFTIKLGAKDSYEFNSEFEVYQ